MPNPKLRQAIAHEAARLMYERVETEYYTAKWKAAKRLCPQRCKPEDLPSNAEIRQLVQAFAHLYEGDRRTDNLRNMRLAALSLMRKLRRFKPRLIGSVMTGHVRQGSDIDLHLFSDSASAITDVLEFEGIQFYLERKQVRKHDETRIFTHIHVVDRFEFELTIYPENQARYVFKSSITGKGIERASIAELEQLMVREYPDLEGHSLEASDIGVDDPYPVFRMLLLPLESVKQKYEFHPEGDALYHTLQVFTLAREHRPYDIEFLLAALLHDVGKALDRHDHVMAGLRALHGLITERTEFFIANHMLAHDYRDGTLAPRKRDRLKQSPDFDDLLLFAELDRAGRVPGAQVGTLEEALEYVKELEQENG